MAEVVAIRKKIEHEIDSEQLRANKARLDFIREIATTDPDFLACVELDLTGEAKAPEATSDRIGAFGIEKVLQDARDFHGLNRFEFGTAYRICEELVAERIQNERNVK